MPSGPGAEEGEDLLRACLISLFVRGGDPNRMRLFSFLFFYHVLCLINYWEQRPRGALAMAKKKPHPLTYWT